MVPLIAACRLTLAAMARPWPVMARMALSGWPGQAGFASLKQSPIAVSFSAAEISAIRCTASGPGVTGLEAGGNASILINARDEYMNDVTIGGSVGTFEVTVIYTDPIRRVNLTIEDLKDGKYSAWTILTLAGSYGIDVKRAGRHISGSPFLIQVSVSSLDYIKKVIAR